MIAMEIVVDFEWYQSEKKLLLGQQTDRIHSFTVLNGFEENY